MGITCGIDWAEAHHDVALVDEDGLVVARARIDTGATGFNALLALIAEHGGQRGRHAGRDRDRQEPARRRAGRGRVHGVSDQPAGGGPLSGTARPGRREVRPRRRRGARAHPAHRPAPHRPLPAISEQARAVKALARQHQEAIWALHQTVSRLRSVLLEFYPQALQAFPNLKHKAAIDRPGRCADPGRSRRS